MTITIHRGNQIGGCITIIEHEGCKIIIDLGSNLPGNKKKEYTEEDVAELTRGVNAIFYTHYHGDHTGLHHLVDPQIPQFMGAGAQEVMLCKYQALNARKDQSKQIESVKRMKSYTAGKPVEYDGSDKIKVTPYFVSHSAFDAYMFLIECDGLNILHTGDFRRHGYLGKGLFPMLNTFVRKVDILITEGTMLGRRQETVLREVDIKQNVIKALREHKYIFALCSSTDLDRLASFHDACRITHRGFFVDDYQQGVLDLFTKYAGKKSSLFNFCPLKGDGFLMPIRSSALDKVQRILAKNFDEEPWLIYSMWSGYAEEGKEYTNENIVKIRSLFNGRILDGTRDGFHTSGHADIATLEEVCQTVNPTIGVIPIHKDEHATYDMDGIQRYKVFTTTEKISDKLSIVLD